MAGIKRSGVSSIHHNRDKVTKTTVRTVAICITTEYPMTMQSYTLKCRGRTLRESPACHISCNTVYIVQYVYTAGIKRSGVLSAHPNRDKVTQQYPKGPVTICNDSKPRNVLVSTLESEETGSRSLPHVSILATLCTSNAFIFI